MVRMTPCGELGVMWFICCDSAIGFKSRRAIFLHEEKEVLLCLFISLGRNISFILCVQTLYHGWLGSGVWGLGGGVWTGHVFTNDEG